MSRVFKEVDSRWNESLTHRIDEDKVQQAIRMILEAIGEDPDRDGLRDTPLRVARMYAEVFSGLHVDPASELSARFEVEHDGLVMVRDIPFFSMCEHHLLPFYGQAHVAYLPSGGSVTGLSKLARLVDTIAKRPQIQERMTREIADTLSAELQPTGVLVLVQAEHMCMNMRGIRKPGSSTMTMATHGIYATDAVARQETLQLLQQRLS